MNKVVPTDAVLIPEQATCVFEGQIFAVYQWQQELFDGSYDTFEMLKRPDTTSVICVVDDKLIVLDEEQPASGKRRSFPGGRVDETDADIIAAAQREVLEETGYTFKHWRLVKVWQPIKKMEWFIYLVLAWGEASQGETTHDPGEKITVEYVDLAELKRLASGKVGYLGESTDLLAGVENLSDLIATPEFQGKTITR